MKLQHLILLAVAGAAWMTWAQHPTARNLRTAVVKSLPLI
jgi:hypothetical protein